MNVPRLVSLSLALAAFAGARSYAYSPAHCAPLMPQPAVQTGRPYSIANATAPTGMLAKSRGLVTRCEC